MASSTGGVAEASNTNASLDCINYKLWQPVLDAVFSTRQFGTEVRNCRRCALVQLGATTYYRVYFYVKQRFIDLGACLHSCADF